MTLIDVHDSAKRSQRSHFMEEDFSRVTKETTLPQLTLLTTALCLHSCSIISPRTPFTRFPVGYYLFYTLIMLLHHYLP